jgi:hypothetical protein
VNLCQWYIAADLSLDHKRCVLCSVDLSLGHWFIHHLHKNIPSVVLAYNRSIHKTFRELPHYLLFVRHPRLPLDSISSLLFITLLLFLVTHSCMQNIKGLLSTSYFQWNEICWKAYRIFEHQISNTNNKGETTTRELHQLFIRQLISCDRDYGLDGLHIFDEMSHQSTSKYFVLIKAICHF